MVFNFSERNRSTASPSLRRERQLERQVNLLFKDTAKAAFNLQEDNQLWSLLRSSVVFLLQLEAACIGRQSELIFCFEYYFFFVQTFFTRKFVYFFGTFLSCFIIYASDSDAEMNENCHTHLCASKESLE